MTQTWDGQCATNRKPRSQSFNCENEWILLPRDTSSIAEDKPISGSQSYHTQNIAQVSVVCWRHVLDMSVHTGSDCPVERSVRNKKKIPQSMGSCQRGSGSTRCLVDRRNIALGVESVSCYFKLKSLNDSCEPSPGANPTTRRTATSSAHLGSLLLTCTANDMHKSTARILSFNGKICREHIRQLCSSQQRLKIRQATTTQIRQFVA